MPLLPFDVIRTNQGPLQRPSPHTTRAQYNRSNLKRARACSALLSSHIWHVPCKPRASASSNYLTGNKASSPLSFRWVKWSHPHRLWHPALLPPTPHGRTVAAASLLAPAPSSSCTASGWPYTQAVNSGVKPFCGRAAVMTVL